MSFVELDAEAMKKILGTGTEGKNSLETFSDAIKKGHSYILICQRKHESKQEQVLAFVSYSAKISVFR